MAKTGQYSTETLMKKYRQRRRPVKILTIYNELRRGTDGVHASACAAGAGEGTYIDVCRLNFVDVS